MIYRTDGECPGWPVRAETPHPTAWAVKMLGGAMGLTRREWIAGAVSAFAFRDATLLEVARIARGAGEQGDEEFWLRIREQFDFDPELTVFNHAGLSPSPIAVRDAIAAQVKRANADPSYTIWRRQDNELGPVRSRLAKLVGCDEDELALTMNATYGLQTILMGVPMERGDSFVTTTHDYPRAFTAMAQRGRRDGTTMTQVPHTAPPEGKDVVAKKVLGAVTDRTKAVLLCQMTFTNGHIFPIREVADGLAGKDVVLFVDAAHGIGLLPQSFKEMKAQAYTACLHKWVMGPIGTGVLAVQRPWIKRIWPLHPADPELDDNMRKFEQVGTRPAAPFLALKECLDFHDTIGMERKAARLEFLRNRLADKVLNAPDVIHYGSLDPAVCRAILAVGFKKAPTFELAGWLLAKHRIHVTTMVRAGMDAIRISPNVFTTLEEVDRLGDILNDVARNGIS